MKRDGFTRREFISKAGGAAAAFTIVPSFVLGANGQVPPSDKLNIAAIGCGGKGHSDINGCKSENIVALCEVDERKFSIKADFPKASTYKDFRKMLDKEGKNIDAVTVSAPDNTHAVAAMAAMKMGKHVYVQKPLAHDVFETRMLTEAARKYKVQTQMGNQGHSGEGIRLLCEWIADGAIGQVREVHVWTDRPGNYWWTQGLASLPDKKEAIPSELDWDLWLGPAKMRPYSSWYLPGVWRGWWDFGTGVMGDMGCHIMDPAFWALKLGAPDTIEGTGVRNNQYTGPLGSLVTYEFPARGDMAAVKMKWYDGGLMPERPEGLEAGRRLGDRDGGVLFVGDKGTIMGGCYGKNPRLIPETSMKAYKRPAKTIKRIPRGISGHYQDWINACKTGEAASSNFDYAGPLTETVLLANVALRAGKKIEWDSKNMKVTNCPEAQQFIKRQYRQGWTL